MRALALVLLLSVAHASLAHAQPSPSPAPIVKETPIYKKWWLWTAVGVVLAVGLTIGLDIGLQPKTPTAQTDFGTYKPF